MESAEFRSLCLASDNVKNLVEGFFDQQTEFIFESSGSRQAFINRIVSSLGVSESEIILVGSSKYGWSMAPNKYGIGFNENSDIDVIIINPDLFDALWINSLDWCYPEKTTPIADLEKAKKRTIKNIFYGAINPKDFIYEIVKSEQYRDLRHIKRDWLRTFSSMSRDYNYNYSRHKVKGRLYRSREHAVLYHVNGVKILQEMWRKDEIR